MFTNKVKKMKFFFLFQYVFAGAFASYDYAIGSKWMMAWVMSALLALAFFIVTSLNPCPKEIEEKDLPKV